MTNKISKEILCIIQKIKAIWRTVYKMVFFLLEGQENRSWINIEDLLRSLPILHFCSLYVRGLLALTCRIAIFLSNVFFSAFFAFFAFCKCIFCLHFFLFWQSYFKTDFTAVFLPYSLHYSLHYSSTKQKLFLSLIGCSFHDCNKGCPPCHWQLYVLCSIALFFQYTKCLPAAQLCGSVSGSNELSGLHLLLVLLQTSQWLDILSIVCWYSSYRHRILHNT